MTDPERPSDRVDLAQPAPSSKQKKPWKVRAAGRLCLLISIPLTYFYLRDVPRAFDYMVMGELSPDVNVFWLEHFVRDFYLSGKFARKVIKAALPASALGFTALLFLLGCAASFAGNRVRVSRSEAFAWTASGAFLLGINAMATWIIWKAFVFL